MPDLRLFASTSNVVRFVLKDKTTGQNKTGLSTATSGLIISTIADNEATATAYTQAGSTVETIATLGTFATPTATKCRFKEVDSTNHKGLYEFQFADARFAVTSAKRLVISVNDGESTILDVDYEIELTQFNPFDGVRLGLTALPNANANANGGLPILSASGTTLGYTISTLTTYTGNTVQTGDAYAVVADTQFGNAKLVRSTTPANTLTVDTAHKVAVTLAAADVSGNLPADLQTIKTQTVTCAASVTVLASVGTAATSTAQTGDSFALIGTAGAGLTALGDTRLDHLDADITSRLAPTVAARTLDVSAGGEAGVDWANVGSPTTTLALTGTTIAATQHVIVDSGTVTTLTNLPSIPANWLTAAGIAAGALDGKGDWLLATDYTAPDNTDIATLITQVGILFNTRIPGVVQPQTGDAYAVVSDATFGNARLVRSTTPANTLTVDSAHKVAVTLASTDVTGNVAADLQTIKTQTVTCAASVTVLASVGTATTDTAQTGDSYARIGLAGVGLTNLGDTRLLHLDADISSRTKPSDTQAAVTVAGSVSGTVNGLTAAALAQFFTTDSTKVYADAVSGSVVKEIAATAGGGGLTIADVQTAMTNQGYTSGRAPNLDDLDATVSSLASASVQPSWYTAPVDTSADVTAIRAQTDSLTFTVAANLNVNVRYVNSVEVTGTGATGDEWGPV